MKMITTIEMWLLSVSSYGYLIIANWKMWLALRWLLDDDGDGLLWFRRDVGNTFMLCTRCCNY